ncbi:MAG: hypothetical protein ACI9RO_001790, partial [Alteromonas macleodii]
MPDNPRKKRLCCKLKFSKQDKLRQINDEEITSFRGSNGGVRPMRT